MTETPTSDAQAPTPFMRLAELQQLAGSMGLKGTSRMRKSELIAAITEARSGRATAPSRTRATTPSAAEATEPTGEQADPVAAATTETPSEDGAGASRPRNARAQRGSGRRRAGAASGAPEHQDAPALDLQLDLPDRSGGALDTSREDEPGRDRRGRQGNGGQRDDSSRPERGEEGPRRGRRRAQSGAGAPEQRERDEHRVPQRDGTDDHRDAKVALMRDLAVQTGTPAVDSSEPRDSRDRDGRRDDSYDDDARGGRRRRGRKRGRDRDDRGNHQGGRDRDDRQAAQGQSREDEVLLPVAGILDVGDNHAYLRTSGYLPGPKDVYVSMQQVRSNGLRPGDALTGWVREGGETEQPSGPRNNRRQNRANRQKYNPIVSIETVNGMDVEQARRRPEFTKLTPLYPQEQLRLETTPKALTPRVIDLVAPIGKGQRGLIVSPPKAGKTIVLQQIANAIAVNNPEAHLMVVLVDERPEEVTDMQRTVKGEVIASTFDRPASDHTIVAELAIERAKRLVELGQDVVVLLDSITRLGRAYNLAAPASGRILSGGVDASALYPPKRFFGAARNVENGGSLTILATALVETGSKMDEVIFEEFKGTGNMELRLSRQLADRRIFPAVDVAASGTRREELLIDPAQLKIMWRLRRLFTGLEQQQALELVLGKLKDTQSNAEFLMVLSKTTPAGNDD